jgi:bifunctional DNA-binding transcriptional regulator/antitoxin component of YhaV-PrlF toxin-antitoxin module
MDQFTCKVDNQGRITLPVEWRNAHHVGPGTDVSVLMTEDRLEVQTDNQSLDEARRIVAKYRHGKHSGVEMLSEDRRRAAQQEQTEADAHVKGV